MATTRPYSPIKKAVVRLGLLAVLLLFLIPAAFSQNTKGDRPLGKGKAKRESRFQKGAKKKAKGKQPFNRVQGKRPTQASRASTTTRVYPQKGRFVNNRSITGKISKQNFRARKTINAQSTSSQQSRRNSGTPRIRPRSVTGSTRNVFPQRGRYVNNPSRTPKTSSQVYSNRREVARNKRITHQSNPPKRRKVVPASASRSYISRRSINPFAGFWNQKPKKEKAHIGDISGRPLRTKNYQTQKPAVLVNPTAHPYRSKPRIGDRPYTGQLLGGYISRTRSGKAWRGDIAGRKIRGRNFRSKTTIEQRGYSIHPPKKSKRRVGDRPYRGSVPGNGKRSLSGRLSFGGKVPGKPPKTGLGVGSYQGNIKGGRKGFSPQGEGYTGSLKTRRPLKGGGSISGRAWNNNKRALQGKSPKSGLAIGSYRGNMKRNRFFSPQGEEYTGHIKAHRPLKGGGTVSGQSWNNDQRALQGKPPKTGLGMGSYRGNIKGRKAFGPQGEGYTGNIKARKPVKGGGSISGRTWNNQQRAINGKMPKVVGYDIYQGKIKSRRTLSPQGEEFTGNIKRKRYPAAGAERVGGYPGKYRTFDLKPGMRNQGEEFTGYTKAKRPVKGGGSISGKLWNNQEKAINGKQPKTSGYDVYQGNLKPKKKPGKEIEGFKPKYHEFDLHPSMRNQGEEFTGLIKLPRFRKQYIKNPNTADAALKKDRPGKSTYKVDGLQVKIKQGDYKQRPHGADGSMPGIGPGKNSIKASEFTKAMRQNWNYKRNPSSSEDAMRQHEPGKAFVKASNYQGNIKMKKFELFAKKELHPDAQFMKTNKNNTDDERSMLTNFKLWWARVFKKSDTQPDHLKEKYRKPRYDKREDGLWAE